MTARVIKERMLRQIDFLSSCALEAQNKEAEYSDPWLKGLYDGRGIAFNQAAHWLAADLGIAEFVSSRPKKLEVAA